MVLDLTLIISDREDVVFAHVFLEAAADTRKRFTRTGCARPANVVVGSYGVATGRRVRIGEVPRPLRLGGHPRSFLRAGQTLWRRLVRLGVQRHDLASLQLCAALTEQILLVVATAHAAHVELEQPAGARPRAHLKAVLDTIRVPTALG